MSDTKRPEWASSPEWGDWRVGTDYGYVAVYRETERFVLEINSAGYLTSVCGLMEWPCQSPALALSAANALAEAAGGYGVRQERIRNAMAALAKAGEK